MQFTIHARSRLLHRIIPHRLVIASTHCISVAPISTFCFTLPKITSPMPRKPRSTAPKPSKLPPSPSPSPADGLLFSDQSAFEAWLEENHITAQAGTWLLISKKCNLGPDTQTLTYDQAVDTSLCFGWIDGQRRSCPGNGDAASTHFLQRFTPRRGASMWSKRNVEKVASLLAQTPCPIRAAGLAQIETAKADGRWERAYAGPKDMVVPSDLDEAIRAKGGAAVAAFEGLSRSKRYPLLHKVETARVGETRRKRIEQIVEMLAVGRV